jgi:intracellular multiplication protein IcmG
MADHDKDNDEYQFIELDADAPSIEGEDKVQPTQRQAIPTSPFAVSNKNIKRNALIVILVLVFVIILYNLFRSSTTSKVQGISQVTTPPTQVVSQSQPVVRAPVVVQASPVASNTNDMIDAQMRQKIAAIELNQKTLEQDLTAHQQILSQIQTDMTTAASKIDELSRIVSLLATKMDEQSRDVLQMMKHVTQVKQHHAARMKAHPVASVDSNYFIQAVIPGRAWLINRSGSTLTVREGTLIPGYGAVRHIDAPQGRVMTASGRVIRFSPEDS